ncbi:MAG: hypothetical protein KatS3mg015_0936 [Fimbriimonadales bacterium]|nr:MAG: hypothetical protein KatS3mg015_0936 [Fimbriimonadales bacterium]
MVSAFVLWTAWTAGALQLPAALDPHITEYYSKAVAAAEAEPHKALAMLELLLVPEGTPITIDFTGVPANLRPTFQAGIERGVGLWQAALGADMPFALNGEPSDTGQVVIRFVDTIPTSDPHTKGQLRMTRRIQWGRSVHYVELDGEIRISKWASQGRYFSADEITHIVAHELGHAFGLGDAPNRDRIMGPVFIGSPYARLNPVEVETVMSFRTSLRQDYARATELAAQSSRSRGPKVASATGGGS